MSSTHICSIKRGSYNALRFQGILVSESYAQIDAMARKSLSDEHALLFAEPVHERSGDYTDWYSPRHGKPVRLTDLPEEEQALQKRRIASLAADLKRHADALMAEESQAKKIRGNILSLALLCPSLEHVYIIDGHPVLTAWGFGPSGAGAEPEDLVRLAAALPLSLTPSKAPLQIRQEGQSAPSRRPFGLFSALSCLLLGILAVLAVYFFLCMLFGPAGCASPGALPRGCTGPLCPACPPEQGNDSSPARAEVENSAALLAAREKEKELQSRLDALRSQLAERIAECPRKAPAEAAPPATQAPEAAPEKALPIEPEAPAAPLAEEPVQKAEEKPTEQAAAEETQQEAAPPSLDALMPTTPEPTTPPEEKPREKPEQSPKEKPKQDAPALKPGEEMRIPDKARQSNDLAFLSGCWTSESGLVSTRGEPVVVQYCFDSEGNGTRTISETRTNTRCSGSVAARFADDGKLILDARRSACNSGGAYVPQRVDCAADKNGKAQCYGTGKSGRRWQAIFRRQ